MLKRLFMRIMWLLEGNAEFQSIDMYKDGTFGVMEFDYNGTRMKLTIGEVVEDK